MAQVVDYVMKRQDCIYATFLCKCWNEKKQTLHCTCKSFVYLYIFTTATGFFLCRNKINHTMKLDGVVICAFILELGMVILLKIRTTRIEE